MILKGTALAGKGITGDVAGFCEGVAFGMLIIAAKNTADSGINVADRIPVEEEAAGWNVTNPRFHS